MSIRSITEEQRLVIRKELLDGKTHKEIAERLGYTRGVIGGAVKKWNLNSRSYTKRESLQRGTERILAKRRKEGREEAERLFGVWTCENAYVFGSLWADGNVGPNQVRMEVKEADEAWVMSIGRFFDPNIHKFKACKKGRNYVGWNFGRKFTSLKLQELGLLQRKSYIDPPYPPVPDQFFSPFARGVFDGDGTITGTKTDQDLVWYGSSRFLEEFTKRAARNWGVRQRRVQKSRGKNVFFVQWCYREEVALIFSEMYKDGGITLERKRDKIKRYLESTVTRRRPCLS